MRPEDRTARRAEPRSADQIQRDIERTQSEIGQTIDAIKRRLSPEEMMNEAAAYFRAGPGEFGRNLGRTIRDNPVPVTLIGLGLGWLMSSGMRSRRRVGVAEDVGEVHEDEWENRSNLPPRLREALDRSRSKAASAKARVREAGHRFRAAGHGASDRLAGLSHGVRARGQQVGDYGQRMWHGIEEQWYEHPLVMGAMAFGIGAAAAIAIPATRREEELVGESSRRMMERARETGAEYYERAKDVARSVGEAGYVAAREEAEAQGVPGSSRSSEASSASERSRPTGDEASSSWVVEPSEEERGR